MQNNITRSRLTSYTLSEDDLSQTRLSNANIQFGDAAEGRQTKAIAIKVQDTTIYDISSRCFDILGELVRHYDDVNKSRQTFAAGGTVVKTLSIDVMDELPAIKGNEFMETGLDDRSNSEVTSSIDIRSVRNNLVFWIDYSGAMADVHASLDDRLEGHDDIKGMIVELLMMVERNLRRLPSKEAGTLRDSSDTASRDRHHISAVESALDRMHSLARAIRQGSVRTYEQEALDNIDDENRTFQANILLYLKQKHPNASSGLRNFLVDIISGRRRVLLSRQRHAIKLGIKRQKEVPITTGLAPPAQTTIEETRDIIPPCAGDIKDAPRILPSVGGITAVSKLNRAAVLKRISQPTLSDRTTGSLQASISMSAEFPEPPSISHSEKYIQCPYCSQRLELPTIEVRKATNNGYWRRHVHQDLQPYVCPFRRCNMVSFGKRSDWKAHMSVAHSATWPREVYTDTWYCDIGHNVVEFVDELLWREHMTLSLHPSWSKLPSNVQLENLASRKQKKRPRGLHICLFCEDVPHSIAKLKGQGNLTDTTNLLLDHIADHFQSLLLMALPSTYEKPAEADTPSDISEKRSCKHEIGSRSEASLPSGADFLDHVTLTFDDLGHDIRFSTQNSHLASHSMAMENVDPEYVSDEFLNQISDGDERETIDGYSGSIAAARNQLWDFLPTRKVRSSAVDIAMMKWTNFAASHLEEPYGSSDGYVDSKECHQVFLTSPYECHKNRNPTSVEGTCVWFLKHHRYLGWRDGNTSGLLWVSADPGCGKSVLSRLLVDKEMKSTETRATCYFFFKDDNEDQKTATNALCAILHQLFSQKPGLLCHARKFYAEEGKELKTNTDSLWRILLAAASDPQAGDIICILDALEECRQSELDTLLSKVTTFYDTLGEKGSLKFLMTSRPLHRIEHQFNELIHKIPEIRLAGEEDTDQIRSEINLVIQNEIDELNRDWPNDQQAIAALHHELINVEHRTYLWLILIFELIHQDLLASLTRTGRKKLFGTIPSSVDDAYTAILNQSSDMYQARKLLSIVCVATRPLSVEETFIAINIQKDDKSIQDLDKCKDSFMKTWIRNLCGLFVSVIDGKVYLLHQTAKEFLMTQNDIVKHLSPDSDSIWKHSLSVSGSNFLLAQSCMWYIQLDELCRCRPPTNHQDIRLLLNDLTAEYGFLKYSASEWARHLCSASATDRASITAMAIDLCEAKADQRMCWELLYSYRHFEGLILPIVLLASALGLLEVVCQLLEAPGVNANHADENGQTALTYAAKEGHEAIIMQLLMVPGIDVNNADKYGQTTLIWAAREGHEAIVTQLIMFPGIDVNHADKYGQTALQWATMGGYEAIITQLLMVPGIDVNHIDESGQTALMRATKEGHEAIVKQLILVPGIKANVEGHEASIK